MLHPLDESVEAMLTPERLSVLAGQAISEVRRVPLWADYAKSGSRLSLVETTIPARQQTRTSHGAPGDGGLPDSSPGPCFVLKQISSAWDWQMRATDDRLGRAVTLWQQGMLDRLPAEIEHAVVACAVDEPPPATDHGRGSIQPSGWAILMRDFRGLMLPYARFSFEDNAFFLEAMAALHATFFEARELVDPGLGLCQLPQVYGIFSPATGWREAGLADEVPKRILEGWALLPSLVEPDVATVILDLLEDPGPLCAALARYPHTLVHGDWRHANQGLLTAEAGAASGPPRRLVLLDWQLAAVGPPAIDMGRCLATNSALLPGTKEETIAVYREQLASRLGSRFNDAWWQPQLELGLLGGFLQDGWAVALKATHWHIGADARDRWRADLQWWSQQVRAGLRWL